MKKSALTGLLAAATFAVVACGSTVDDSDVERQVSDLVESQLGTPESVDCPSLDAEEGKSVTCTATVDGEEHEVKVTVTDVTDDTAKFDIELVGGGSSSSSEETTEPTRTRTSESSTRRTTTSRTTESTSTGDYVPADDVENQIVSQLPTIGRSVDSASCVDDLPAVVGESIDCEFTDGADTYGVTVEVTSIEGTQVLFDIRPADVPN